MYIKKRLLPFRKLPANYPRKYPKKAFRKDSYRTYIRSGGSIKATTMDINRRKKETVNPFSPLPNYL